MKKILNTRYSQLRIILILNFSLLSALSFQLSAKQSLAEGQSPAVVALPSEEIDQQEEIEILLKDLESKNWQIRQEAKDKLTNLGKRTIAVSAQKLQLAPAGLKGQIIFILGNIKDKEATPALIETLKDDNAYIRRNAVEALGKIKDERALGRICATLFDKDASVRAYSAWALGELKDSRAVKDLIKRLTEEKEERVKIAIVKTLGTLEDLQATAVLLKELKPKSDQLYKNEVVTALGEIADPRALPRLRQYLKKLKSYKLTEPIVIFQWEQAIKIAETAIQKIQNRQ